MSETGSPSPRAAAVLVAAGDSTRMRSGGAEVRKPWIQLAGRSILERSCAVFEASPSVTELVIVAHPDDVTRIEDLGRSSPALAKLRAVLPGGRERADSVRLGARAVSPDAEVIAVHDAARPLVGVEQVDRAIRTARDAGAALVAVPLRDTIKSSEDGRAVVATLDRSSLWAAQTPQCFEARRFLELLERAELEGFRPTDDAALWERYVGPVAIVEGSAANLKLTTVEDLEIAEAILAVRKESR